MYISVHCNLHCLIGRYNSLGEEELCVQCGGLLQDANPPPCPPLCPVSQSEHGFFNVETYLPHLWGVSLVLFFFLSSVF